jgi:hypothetical protein
MLISNFDEKGADRSKGKPGGNKRKKQRTIGNRRRKVSPLSSSTLRKIRSGKPKQTPKDKTTAVSFDYRA